MLTSDGSAGFGGSAPVRVSTWASHAAFASAVIAAISLGVLEGCVSGILSAGSDLATGLRRDSFLGGQSGSLILLEDLELVGASNRKDRSCQRR